MIKWISPIFDHSGYAQANRDYIYALHKQTKDIFISPLNYLTKVVDGLDLEFFYELTNKQIPYKYVIHHYPPEQIDLNVQKNKINIGCNTWETTKLPDHWVENMNKYLTAVFVPSSFNKKYYEENGVKIPIEIIPYCFNIHEQCANSILPKELDQYFKFISVFQWTERKNPIGLLKAYFSTFTEDDKVILILKTYASDDSLIEQTKICSQINQLKVDMNLNYYPPIYFIGNLLERKQVFALYSHSDCFVLPSRGEGFGMPYAEAALFGNQIIATAFGGQTDFLDCSFTQFIDYQLAPVSGMAWIPNYNAHMYWAEPNIETLQKQMRYAYNQRFDKQIASNHIQSTLNYDKIGNLLLNTILKYGD